MLRHNQRTTILELRARGIPLRQICRTLGLSRAAAQPLPTPLRHGHDRRTFPARTAGMTIPNGEDAQAQYVRAVLAAYRATPTVLGHVRRADRNLAAALYERRVRLYLVETALLVAAARRVLNNAFSTPPPPIRSLAYILPVIAELQQRPLGYRDIDDLHQRLRQALLDRY